MALFLCSKLVDDCRDVEEEDNAYAYKLLLSEVDIEDESVSEEVIDDATVAEKTDGARVRSLIRESHQVLSETVANTSDEKHAEDSCGGMSKWILASWSFNPFYQKDGSRDAARDQSVCKLYHN